VAHQPSFEHQFACSRIVHALASWDPRQTPGVTLFAPGFSFAEDDNVASDCVGDLFFAATP
jgi:hypothetical protein